MSKTFPDVNPKKAPTKARIDSNDVNSISVPSFQFDYPAKTVSLFGKLESTNSPLR